jgi:hypothetical protein
MAIKTLSRKDRALPTLGTPSALPLTDQQTEDLARTYGGQSAMEDRLASAAEHQFVITWEGCVLRLGEHNYYDDSDFYAIVWDAQLGAPREIEYGTTRGWSYWNSASVDATDEVLAAFNAYKAEQARVARAEREAWEAQQPYVGRTVKVIKAFRAKGVRVEVGTVATITWYGEDKYNSHSLLKKYRCGFDVNGQRVFASAANVEVVLGG